MLKNINLSAFNDSKGIYNKTSRILVSCSGGSDSMSVLHYLYTKKFNVSALFIHHNTLCSDESYLVVQEFCNKNNIPFSMEYIKVSPDKDKENVWREERYDILQGKARRNFDFIVTGHNLNDNIENYVISMVKGHKRPRLIPYKRENIIRPLLKVRKVDIYNYCHKHSIPYYEDPTNRDPMHNQRAYLRQVLIPNIKHLNPGIEKTVTKLIEEETL